MFPFQWQLFSQHKHWHGDSHLLVCCLVLFSLLARLISLGFHHRASAESASKLWKWLPWQAPGILSIWGWWVHLIYCGPVQKSSFHSSTLELAVAASGYEYPAPPTSFPIYTLLSSLSLLLSLWRFIYLSFFLLFLSLQLSSASSSAPCYCHPLCSSQCNQPSLLFLAKSDLFSYSHNSEISYLPFTHSPFHFSCSLPICLYVSSLSTYSCHRLH